MANCECLEGCPFFNDKMDNMPALANIFKKNFCRGDYSQCARHMVFEKLGKPAVPPTLFPNEKEKAETILAKA